MTGVYALLGVGLLIVLAAGLGAVVWLARTWTEAPGPPNEDQR